MGGVTTPEMVAAVSNAGGLGILAGVGTPPDVLRQGIRRIRELTRLPFGVNLILHDDVRPPADVSRLPADLVESVNQVLNRFRERLGLPPRSERPPQIPDLIPQAIDAIIDERVPLFSIGLGRPSGGLVERCHARSIKVSAMVTTSDDAVICEEAGVDVIVAQGSEAGGHRSTWSRPASREHGLVGTLALVPEVADRVTVPVVAAGGISDGRGVAACLALGAAGVQMGTRFIACDESEAPPFHQQALTAADGNATTVSDAFTGMYARVLRNTYVEEYAASGAPVFPPVVQLAAAADIMEASAKRQSGEYFPMYAGQGAGLVRDRMPAGELVARLVREAEEVLRRLAAPA